MERARRAARPAQLALPAGAVSRLLRRVRAQPAAARDGDRGARARAAAQGRDAASRARRWPRPRRILAEAQEKPAAEWRQRVYTLAEALFQSIRQQLSVARYGAIAVGRGATLDSLETPLNNSGWLQARFAEAAALTKEDERLAAIDRIVQWTDPGPGGYYDDLGNAAQQPHLVRGLPYREDPQRFKSTMTGFGYRPDWRLSWMTHAESFWDTPLQMRYTGSRSGGAVPRPHRLRRRRVQHGHTHPARRQRQVRGPPADPEAVASQAGGVRRARRGRRAAAS